MIDLCLSGGGVRAAVFHLGVLKALAEKEILNKVERISTVSGGSLLTGLLFHENSMKWPSDEEYLDGLHDNLLSILTGKDLQHAYVKNLLLNPTNWPKITASGAIMGKTIESFWGVSETWSAVPTHPVWSVNITSVNTGKRWRVKGKNMGDYLTGYTDTHDFKLSDVMAISAGFPGGIGPYRIHTDNHHWYSYTDHTKSIKPQFKKIDLMDGGLYDNLGLEAVYDCGIQECRECNGDIDRYVIVSDASSPLEARQPFLRLRLFSRAYRMYMISYNQIRALRLRSFIGPILEGRLRGMHVELGGDPEKKAIKAGFQHIPNSSLNKLDRKIVKEYATNLKLVKPQLAEKIVTNSYEQTKMFLENTYPVSEAISDCA